MAATTPFLFSASRLTAQMAWAQRADRTRRGIKEIPDQLAAIA